MPIVADEYTQVIGVDTHARTQTYVVLDTRTGGIIDTAMFPTNPAGLARALAWIDRRTSAGRLAAIEGTSSYGASLTEALQQAGIPVVEARPPRRADRGARGKSDPIDAEAAARAAIASLAGAAPIPASSGNTSRHRLNRHGDRRLNSALETVARVRLSYDPDTRAYKQRRLAEGKTTREVKRMLKRYIARQIYRHLTATMTA